MFDWKQDPHRRLNPLTNEWVLVSPHRTQRPWQGQVEENARAAQPEYDPTCYLCPGNERAGGAHNPKYTSTFIFDNDFAAMRPSTPPDRFDDSGLLVAQGEPGICRVACFSPRHDLTMANMEPAGIRLVVDMWAEQYAELGAHDFIRHVQILENRGAMMGCSNPHPHCQIWADAELPNEIVKEQTAQLAWREARKHCLICDYAALETARQERLVEENATWIAVVPFWAVWPFETMVMPRRHVGSIDALDAAERDGLADILKRVTARYDRLFAAPFPYSMGFHQSPTDGEQHPEWHMHAHFYPPLLRSATVRKFQVGYEMLATPQRDLTPEAAAERLRNA
jgi:UDPglucose--hexose-1-phosphate uridylyltransferase